MLLGVLRVLLVVDPRFLAQGAPIEATTAVVAVNPFDLILVPAVGTNQMSHALESFFFGLAGAGVELGAVLGSDFVAPLSLFFSPLAGDSFFAPSV